MGVDVHHQGSGDNDITIDLTGGSITTSGTASRAIRARRDSGSTTDGAAGDVTISVTDSTISTTATSGGNEVIQAENATAGQGNVSVILRNTTVTSGSGIGIEGERSNGTGNVILDVDGSSIMTNGATSHNIYGEHSGTGKIDIDVKNSTLSTNGNQSSGISASHTGTGDIEIDVDNGTGITTTTGEGGQHARGILAFRSGTATGNIRINLDGGSTITTQGMNADGIEAISLTSGEIAINFGDGSSITTNGKSAKGIFADQQSGASTGVLNINSTGTSMITTKDIYSSGIWAIHRGMNDINVNLSGAEIRTESTQVDTNGNTLSYGIRGSHYGTGNMNIDLRDSSITTSGASSRGIYGLHYGGSSNPTGSMGNIEIATHDGHTITTTGTNSHGINFYHFGSDDDARTIDVSVGGPVNVRGDGSRGVRIGTVSTSNSAPIWMASLGDDGYRRQTVTVNGPITSAGEGVYMAGGGRVIIGPGGSIDSTRRIAILATGTIPEDDSDMNSVIPAIPPKLRVDLNLDGRRVAQVLNDGWIINDGGETTIAVNDTVLHDGATGVTGRTARNGVWNVRMMADGVKVTNYTDDESTMDIDESNPANWTVTDRAGGVIADRDFSATDFTETRRPPPPAPAGGHEDGGER